MRQAATKIPAKSEEIRNIEVVADVVRYARAAPPGTKAKTIYENIKRDYPEVPDREIRQACRTAADLLLKQHQN